MKKISIKIKGEEKSYNLIIGKNILNILPKKINDLCSGTKNIVIFFDGNVSQVHLKKIKSSLKKYKLTIFKINPSEKFKNFNSVNYFLERIMSKNFNRSDLVIAIGGGIVGDLAGFVASVLKRGVHFINIPTTLLAQVDSSIGGKTGVNSRNGKNLIGSFHQPKLVISDINFLNTLSKRQMICGYAEILKHAIIKDIKFFKWLKLNSSFVLNKNKTKLIYAIKRSCEIKSEIVRRDANEKNLRMILNFGHTFAHAIETKNNYKKNINHGEAVLLGMEIATKFSLNRKICSIKTAEEVFEVFKKNKLNSNLRKNFSKINLKSFINLMKKDKKNNDEKINLILLKKIGITTIPGTQKFKSTQIETYLKKII